MATLGDGEGQARGGVVVEGVMDLVRRGIKQEEKK